MRTRAQRRRSLYANLTARSRYKEIIVTKHVEFAMVIFVTIYYKCIAILH